MSWWALWRVQKGLKSQEAIFIFSFRAQSIVPCSPQKLHEKKQRHLKNRGGRCQKQTCCICPVAWGEMVDRRLPDRDWEGVKEAEIARRYCQFASNWGQITPGRQICWIYYLDLFDSLPALLLLLLYESVSWKSVSKKKENGFHNKDRKPTASHAVWWMSTELHKNM